MTSIRCVLPTLCFVIAAAVLSMPSLAQDKGKEEKPVFVKLAVIDMDEIRRKSLAIRDIGSQIKTLREGLQAAVKKEEEELRNANQELARQRTILSPEAFAEERRKFEQNLVTVQRSVQKRKQDLDRVQAQALQKVQLALNEVISGVANENELTLIFRKKQTILVAKQLEVTKTVLSRLDKKLPKVKVASPGQ